jgi:hypothetical protein
MTDQQHIRHLEFLLQEERAKYAELHRRSKNLIDAAISYEKTPQYKQDDRKKKFIILKNCEKALKETIYPTPKKISQAKLDWLGQ